MLLSGQVLASDLRITVETQPNRMLVLSSAGGYSSESFPVVHGDLRDIPFKQQTGKITGISYVSAGFSKVGNETAELCFYRAYSSAPLKCETIQPSYADTIYAFNDLEFRAGISASIIHTVPATGSFHYLEASRKESITFHYAPN